MKPEYSTLPINASSAELCQAKEGIANFKFKWSPCNGGQSLTRPDVSKVYWHVELFIGGDRTGPNFADECFVLVGDAEPKAFAARVELLLAVKCMRECLAAA
jgi:hypothetical protein